MNLSSHCRGLLAVIFCLLCQVNVCGGDFDLEDIGEWFFSFITETPKIIVKCVLNDIEQFLDLPGFGLQGDCGYEAFRSEQHIPPPEGYNPHKEVRFVESSSKQEVFVFDTSDPYEIKYNIECADPNIEDIYFTADLLMIAAKGIRKANVFEYVAVCLLEEVLESVIGCFERSTTACRIHNKETMSPQDAYDHCFTNQEEGIRKDAELVPMSDLMPGDLVLSETIDGELFVDNVLVNLHRKKSGLKSPLVKIFYSETDFMSMTPNHMLFVDGQYKAASQVAIGSTLSNGKTVTKIKNQGQFGEIINPLTSSGTILAAAAAASEQGGGNVPILATTSIDSWFGKAYLNSYAKSYSISLALAEAFPFHVQEYYDAYLEQVFDAIATLQSPKAIPSFVILLLCDFVVAGGFILHVAMQHVWLVLFAVSLLITWLSLRFRPRSMSKTKKNL